MNFRHRHPWIIKVHAEMLRAGEELRASEIEARWGKASGRTSTGIRMSNAMRRGWFSSRPSWVGHELKYKALHKDMDVPKCVKDPSELRTIQPFARIGRDFSRVPSVFELARFL